MKEKDLSHCVSVYKKLLKEGDIQIAYAGLVKYVQKLRAEFHKDLGHDYFVGNVLQGFQGYFSFIEKIDIKRL